MFYRICRDLCDVYLDLSPNFDTQIFCVVFLEMSSYATEFEAHIFLNLAAFHNCSEILIMSRPTPPQNPGLRCKYNRLKQEIARLDSKELLSTINSYVTNNYSIINNTQCRREEEQRGHMAPGLKVKGASTLDASRLREQFSKVTYRCSSSLRFHFYFFNGSKSLSASLIIRSISMHSLIIVSAKSGR